MKLAILALALLPLAAVAQTPSAPTPDPLHPPPKLGGPPPTPAQSANPPHINDMQSPGQVPADLDAMRHHQPTRDEVNAREKQREGNDTVEQRNRAADKELDELSRELLGKPASK